MCIFVVNFVIDPSLRGLRWLEEGLGFIFVLKSLYFWAKGGTALGPPQAVSAPGVTQ